MCKKKLKHQFKVSTEISTAIQINTAQKEIWNVLTECDHYSYWNSFVYYIKRRLRVGENEVDASNNGISIFQDEEIFAGFLIRFFESKLEG